MRMNGFPIPSNQEEMSTPEPGLRRQVMSYSPAMMLVRHTMKKAWVGQFATVIRTSEMVYIVSGRIRFEYPDGTFEVGPGD